MANVDFAAIRTRLYAVLEDGVGLVRVISAGTHSGDYWNNAEGWAGKARAIQKPTFWIRFMPLSPHEQRPSLIGSEVIRRIEVAIDIEYALPIGAEATSTRNEAMAQAEQDCDVIAQAFEWEGNLDYPTTGIVSGWLLFEGTTPVLEDWIEGRLVLQQRYSGTVHVTAAVS